MFVSASAALFFGPFYLTVLLIDVLCKEADARILFFSDDAEASKFSPNWQDLEIRNSSCQQQHQQSRRGAMYYTELFVQELNRRLRQQRSIVVVHSVDNAASALRFLLFASTGPLRICLVAYRTIFFFCFRPPNPRLHAMTDEKLGDPVASGKCIRKSKIVVPPFGQLSPHDKIKGASVSAKDLMAAAKLSDDCETLWNASWEVLRPYFDSFEDGSIFLPLGYGGASSSSANSDNDNDDELDMPDLEPLSDFEPVL